MVTDMIQRLRLHRPESAFTLIELVIVLAIVALLLTLAAPRYFHSIDKSKETVLKANLAMTREAIDKYYGDNGKYPEQLDTLVTAKYLRSLPLDPIAESSTAWTIVPPDNPEKGGVLDIHSSVEGKSSDGTPYNEW